MKYIAVFKSLSYAQRIQNKFKTEKLPLITKTPKSIAGGCSYSIGNTIYLAKFDCLFTDLQCLPKGINFGDCTGQLNV